MSSFDHDKMLLRKVQEPSLGVSLGRSAPLKESSNSKDLKRENFFLLRLWIPPPPTGSNHSRSHLFSVKLKVSLIV